MNTPVAASMMNEAAPAGARERPHWIDEVLADSFPASDPPSWSPGMARPASRLPRHGADGRETRLGHLPHGVRTEAEHLLEPGDRMPHVRVRDVRGQTITYSAIWQHHHLVLVALPAAGTLGSFWHYLSHLASRLAPPELETACVITREAVPGLPCPGLVVADRWGEIVHVVHGTRATDLTGPDEVVAWVDYLQRQCPECEGEAK